MHMQTTVLMTAVMPDAASKTCQECGLPPWKLSEEANRMVKTMEDQRLLLRSLVPDTAMFYSGINCGYVVTPELGDALRALGLTNIVFTELQLVDSL
jgi:hypothetical protein